MGSIVHSKMNFNPRSHERSDNMRQFVSDSYNISIHAPTRGATEATVSSVKREYISIHAPTRGATLASYGIKCDIPISIHAPTRGATHILILQFVIWKYFNPRSHERSDQEEVSSTIFLAISIHAPTRGAT